MFNIADYFKKFARIEGDSLMRRDAIKSALLEACGADIDFDIKKGTIYIKAPPAAKALVYTKKETILALIKKSHPEINVLDIR